MNGFTLTEVLITMVVISIVSLISLSLLSQLMRAGGGETSFFMKTSGFDSEVIEVKRILSSFLNKFMSFNADTDTVWGHVLYPDGPVEEYKARVTYTGEKLVFEQETPYGGKVFEVELKYIESVSFTPVTDSATVGVNFSRGDMVEEFVIGSEP